MTFRLSYLSWWPVAISEACHGKRRRSRPRHLGGRRMFGGSACRSRSCSRTSTRSRPSTKSCVVSKPEQDDLIACLEGAWCAT